MVERETFPVPARLLPREAPGRAFCGGRAVESVNAMRDFSGAAFSPEAIESMTNALDQAVATLPEPVCSAYPAKRETRRARPKGAAAAGAARAADRAAGLSVARGSDARAIFAAIRNDRPPGRLTGVDPENAFMSEDFQPPPYVYEGLDPVRLKKTIFAEVSEVAKSAAVSLGQAVKKGREPGMPLDVLSKLTREAPLGALAVAFLCGVIVARRR